MADITNPEIIAFTSKTMRPLCERIRALDYEMKAAVIAWNEAKTASGITNNSDPLMDGREAEGISRLLASDLFNVMATIVPALEAVCVTGNYELYISKPCVEPLRVIGNR